MSEEPFETQITDALRSHARADAPWSRATDWVRGIASRPDAPGAFPVAAAAPRAPTRPNVRRPPASRFFAWSVAFHAVVFLGFASFRVAEHIAERPATVVAAFDPNVELTPDPIELPPMVDLPDRPTEEIETDEPPPLETNIAPDLEFPDVRSIISVTDRLASTPRVTGRRRPARDGVAGGTGNSSTATIAPTPAPPPPPPPPPAPPPVVERTPLRLLSSPHPTYPESAKESRIEGTVMLEAVVQEDGTVGEVRIIESSGSKALDDAAVRAVRRWQFEPERIDGVAQRATVRLPAIKFRLE